MERKCLRCGNQMLENCKANISGSGQYVSQISKKNGLLKKIQSDCSVAVCSNCGYVELYVDEPHYFVVQE